MIYCDVILPFSLPQLFTYHLNGDQEKHAKRGMRAIVAFGKSKLYTAVIYSLHNNKPTEYNTKEIVHIVDDEVIVNEYQFKLWNWMAQYYMCATGEIYKAALPSGLKLESETQLFLNHEFEDTGIISPGEEQVLTLLANKDGITVKHLNTLLEVKSSYHYIKSLITKNAISTEQLLDSAFKPKMITYIEIQEEYSKEEKLESLFTELKRAPAQQKLLLAYVDLVNTYNSTIEKSQLLQHGKSSHAILNTLVKKGVFQEVVKEISRLTVETGHGEMKSLNNAQQKAYASIKQLFESKNTVLLHGVTSSGKTEIYIKLIYEMLEEGKQVLYMLPEIALTTQIINRLRHVFGDKVGVYHSKFNDNERVEVYQGVMNSTAATNNFQLILGVRSSVFLPFYNLGLIIVDEEHENTYKQYDPAPRYHARDTAIYLATLHKAKVLLGTATPSIESFYNAKTGKYGMVELMERYQQIELPEIIISDTKEAYRKKQMRSVFTPVMLDEIKLALDRGEQTILFKNRRGYAPYLECNACNWIPYCKNCDVTLTYHKNKNELNCHYCGFNRPVPVVCDVCNQAAIQTKGYGTEKIEDELSVFFPTARIMRMDMDSTRSKKAFEKIIHAIEEREVDIIVGTQMISKGLDFENVSLVGILNADNMLNFPDFRAHERSFQLMAQVSGRAGRKNKRGKVIIQVADAGHAVINNVLTNNYKSLFIRQLEERKLFRYPPFYRLILLKVKHVDKAMVNKAAYYLAAALFKQFGNRITGPEFPLVERVQNLFQKNIMIKLESNKDVSGAKILIQQSIHRLLSEGAYKQVRVLVDVDPM